jgi:hypothetical protein
MATPAKPLTSITGRKGLRGLAGEAMAPYADSPVRRI